MVPGYAKRSDRIWRPDLGGPRALCDRDGGAVANNNIFKDLEGVIGAKMRELADALAKEHAGAAPAPSASSSTPSSCRNMLATSKRSSGIDVGAGELRPPAPPPPAPWLPPPPPPPPFLRCWWAWAAAGAPDDGTFALRFITSVRTASGLTK